MQFSMPWPGPDVAREAEAAGVAAFCTGEFADHDAYVSLAEMAANTSTAVVGTAIAYAYARTPFAHASAARSINRIAPGRLFLGLGSGAYSINRDWLGVAADRPVARMTETVRVVRAYLDAENGDPISFHGEFYDINARIAAPVLGKLDIPIIVGAFNTKMVTAAATYADGIVGHGLFTKRWWDEVIRPATTAGALAREPARSAVEHGWVITAINDQEPERAIRDAKLMVAFYLTVKTYDPYISHHGWEAPVAALRQAFTSRDFDAMASAVTDDMLNAVALAGSTADAIATLRARGDGLPRDYAFFSPPSFMVSRRRGAEYAQSSLGLIDAVAAR